MGKRGKVMANNYRAFSQMIKEITAEEKDWIENEAQKTEEDYDGYDYDGWLGFDYEFTAQNSFWIYTEESGDPSRVAQFVQAFLKEFRPSEVFVMNWADFCSKPRIEEFGGGAIVVSADRIKVMDSYCWAENQKDRLLRKMANYESV